MSEKIRLKDLFAGLQEQIEARFSVNREFITHPGSKGDALENVWIEWLRNYLPNRYCVDKAFVIDSKGQLSQQLDLVIYDQHFTPFVFNQDGALYIPAEGVYAVFEVKPEINKGYIEYAGDKIASVRKLHRTSTNIIDRGKLYDPRSLTKIVGGLLAVKSSIEPVTIEKHLKALEPLESFDMGCAVVTGSYYVNYHGKESPDIQDFNKRITTYYQNRQIEKIEFSNPKHSLVTFFLQLSRYLQQSIGTVAAIDLGAYAKAIKFEIDEEI
mgnify:CR=1 FL=1|tara:strand:- start:14558 stop:15364 length:807 start_codon:yes stop_codon:yes gene_type:complete